MMGLFSSSSKKTYVTNEYDQRTDQSYKDYSREYEDSFNRDYSREYDDSFNTYTDLGAIDGALGLANNSLGTVEGVVYDSLNFGGDTVNKAFGFGNDALRAFESVASDSMGIAARATDNALSYASNVTKTALNPDSDTLKYALIGLGLIAAAMVVKK